MTLLKKDVSDITFIGSGIATSYAILGFLEELKNKNVSKALKISIIDKYPQFFCGIPYGKRSGDSVLLINSLCKFLPDDERFLFVGWLKEKKEDLIEAFLLAGGEESKRWLSNNIEDIEKDNWDELFIPRSFFGKFIVQRVNNALKQAETKKLVEIDYIVSEVLDFQKQNKLFEIKLSKNKSLISKKIVLSLGSLPTNKIYTENLLLENPNFLLFNDIYNEGLDINFKSIENFLLNRKKKETNVLIIGANASSLEIIYKLHNKNIVNDSITNYIILSSKKVMPDSQINEILLSNYLPIHLHQLQNREKLTAEEIAHAAFKDLDLAEKINLGPASTSDIISLAFGVLLDKMETKEQEIFACKYGNEIGRRQRCAGNHYTTVVDKLKKAKKFVHIAGRFSNIIKENESSYKLEYYDTKTDKKVTFQKNIHLTVNCIGSIDFENKNVPILLKNIISKEYCVTNDSKKGLKVNNKFESIKNLHVAGPLLAGNVINGKPLWHLEHCGRIIWTSNLLSKYLL